MTCRRPGPGDRTPPVAPSPLRGGGEAGWGRSPDRARTPDRRSPLRETGALRSRPGHGRETGPNRDPVLLPLSAPGRGLGGGVPTWRSDPVYRQLHEHHHEQPDADDAVDLEEGLVDAAEVVGADQPVLVRDQGR